MHEYDNSRRRFFSAVIGSFVAASLLLFSPDLAALKKNIRFERISVEDGLSYRLVTSIAQDQQGFMWFATVVGLNKYDGYRITTYHHDPDDPTSISDNEVRAIFVDSQGVLWAATSAGLNRFNGGTETFTRFRHDPDDPSSLSTDQLASIYEDSQGTLWIGTWSEGLSRFDPTTESFIHYRHDPEDPSSLSPGPVRVIYEGESKILWVGTFSHDGTADLNRFDRDTGSFSRFFSCNPAQLDCPRPRTDQDRPPNPMVAGLLEDRHGNLWIGGYGLIKYDPSSNTYQLFTHDAENPDSIAANNPSGNIIEDRNGRLWFGDSNAGLGNFDPVTETFNSYRYDISDPNSISSDSIFDIFEDRSGSIWVATYTGGVSRFDPRSLAFGAYRHDPNDARSLSPGAVEAAAEDHDGILWIGVDGPMLNRIDRKNDRVTRYQHNPSDPASLESDSIMALFVDSSNRLWIGHTSGLSRFDAGSESFVHYPVDALGENDTPVRSFAEDKNGYLWLGTTYTISRLEPESGAIVHYRANTELPNALRGERFKVSIAQDGVLWITTMTAGINRFDPETGVFTNYQYDPNNPNSLSQGYAKWVYPDPNGMIWIGTNSGLNKFDPVEEIFTRYTSKDGLPEGDVQSIVPDRDGYLWVSTANGISRFHPETMSVTTFDTSDGLVAQEACCGLELSSGELVFLSGQGINIFDPDDLVEVKEDLSVVLTDFLLFNQSVPVNSPESETPLVKHVSTVSEITLEHDDYLFSFEFSALAYANSAAVRYAYMLEGFDKDWIGTDTSKRSATYTNVPPGKYVLRVRAGTNDDNWVENVSPVRLHILPPIWRTWLAYTLYAVVFVLSMLAIIKMRTHSLTRHALLLEKTVEDRTREIREHEELIQHQADHLEELLHAKEKLYTNISHEFRTPLTLILGPLKDSIRKTKDKVIAEQLEMAKRSGQRLLRLVDQLLGLSRLGSEEPLTGSAQPVMPVLETITKSFEPLAHDKNISLMMGESDNLWVNCSSDALEKIILNLFSNAVKYTPAGGSITVVTKSNGQDMVDITVADTGVGIPEEHLETVFDRFHRVDDVGESAPGAGIGLALVKGLVEAHGGSVELSSTLGQGTTVTVSLPRHQIEPGDIESQAQIAETEAVRLEVETLSASESAASPATSRASDGKDLVLIVEDNVDMQTYLTQMLSETYDCNVAGDGETGVASALEHVPDLVLCDVMLPKMDGYEVSQILKKDLKTSHIPIIMLTARGDQDSRLKGLREKVDDYLTKPFNDEELKLRIQNLLEIRKILKNRFNGHFYEGSKSGNGLNEKENGFVERLENVLEQHHGNPEFGPAKMASEMAVSDRQLQRKLKALTDHQPADYLRAYRLKKALELLKKGTQVALVAEAVGFSSQSYFSTCFKAQFGATPKQVQQISS